MKEFRQLVRVFLVVCMLALSGIASAQPFRSQEMTVTERLAQRARSTENFNSPNSGVRLLSSNRFFGCEKESLSVNMWLVSKHTSHDSGRELNEKNRGAGLFYSCDGWSTGFDQMINSNRGQATVLSFLWGTRVAEIGPIFLNGKIGYARVSYEVPRYNVTLYENSAVGFVGIGLTRWPKFTLNIAPVPKTAGNAYIAWVSYEVLQFK